MEKKIININLVQDDLYIADTFLHEIIHAIISTKIPETLIGNKIKPFLTRFFKANNPFPSPYHSNDNVNTMENQNFCILDLNTDYFIRCNRKANSKSLLLRDYKNGSKMQKYLENFYGVYNDEEYWDINKAGQNFIKSLLC